MLTRRRVESGLYALQGVLAIGYGIWKVFHILKTTYTLKGLLWELGELGAGIGVGLWLACLIMEKRHRRNAHGREPRYPRRVDR